MRCYGVQGSEEEGLIVEHAPDVLRVATAFVNAYILGTAEGWILVDTGLPGAAPLIRRGVAARFGSSARPLAIVLTHGHFDHAGNADALALEWDVPILAHPLEMPYLIGRSDYPPIDSTMGGAIAVMARTFSRRGRKLAAQVLPLSGDTVPGAPEWRWIHTPGHTHGHVSLFRESDRTLIAGDALITMDMDSWTEQVQRTPEPSLSPSAAERAAAASRSAASRKPLRRWMT